jgi:hypothetical protein
LGAVCAMGWGSHGRGRTASPINHMHLVPKSHSRRNGQS